MEQGSFLTIFFFFNTTVNVCGETKIQLIQLDNHEKSFNIKFSCISNNVQFNKKGTQRLKKYALTKATMLYNIEIKN